MGVTARSLGCDIAGGPVTKLVGVRLGDYQRAGGAQPGYYLGVLAGGWGVGEYRAATPGGRSRNVDEVLDGDRYPP
jgi:hypothetical protein